MYQMCHQSTDSIVHAITFFRLSDFLSRLWGPTSRFLICSQRLRLKTAIVNVYTSERVIYTLRLRLGNSLEDCFVLVVAGTCDPP